MDLYWGGHIEQQLWNVILHNVDIMRAEETWHNVHSKFLRRINLCSDVNGGDFENRL